MDIPCVPSHPWHLHLSSGPFWAQLGGRAQRGLCWFLKGYTEKVTELLCSNHKRVCKKERSSPIIDFSLGVHCS